MLLGHAARKVLLVPMPVFSLSTGLRTEWGVGLAGRVLGWSRDETLAVGLLLQTKALIMIIFSNVLLDKQIISADAFTALLVMAVASTMITVPAVTPLLRRLGVGVGAQPPGR